jgi:hypothetical protein
MKLCSKGMVSAEGLAKLRAKAPAKKIAGYV